MSVRANTYSALNRAGRLRIALSPYRIVHSPAETSQTLFARHMKAAREKLGISQKELGIQAGIDEYCASARINPYERGKHTPDFLTVQNLAKVLKVSTAYFFAENDKLAELIAAFGLLKAADLKSPLATANSLSDKACV